MFSIFLVISLCLICISLMTDFEHVFIDPYLCLLCRNVYLFVFYLFKKLAICLMLLNFKSSLYILHTVPCFYNRYAVNVIEVYNLLGDL